MRPTGRLGHRLGSRARRAWHAASDRVAAAGRRRLWGIDGAVSARTDRIASTVTHLGGWMHDLPGLPLWRVEGDDDLILYAGERRRLEVLAPLLGHRPEQVKAAGRVPLVGLRERVARWRGDGVPLVVCELARRQPLAPRGADCVAVHEWVDLRLAIDGSTERLLSGPQFRGIRPRLNRARRDGIGWRLSRDINDLRHFYDTMYVPTLRARHGTRAQLTPYATQRDWWFRHHGVLLVERDGKAIGGSLLHLKGEAAYGVESGVLNGDEGLYQQGLGTVLVYACLHWAREQGARVLDMGGSRPWLADGALRFKLGWGAAITARPLPGREWTFCFAAPSAPLAARINRAGLLTETAAGHRRVLLGGVDDDTAAQPATVAGVDGVLRVPARRPGLATATALRTKGRQGPTEGERSEYQNQPCTRGTTQAVP